MQLLHKEPISLFEDVPPRNPDTDDDDHIVEERRELPDDATIEGAWCRNYVGHDFDLRYRFFIEHDGDRRSLINHLGKEFITGDDDKHPLDVREEVQEGDAIIIQAENNETEYLYHANARVSVDYEGGLMGLINRVVEMLPYIGEGN